MVLANRHNIITIIDDIKNQFDWASIFKKSYEKNIMPKALVSYSGKITFANDAFCNLFGYSLSELERLSWMDLTVPEYIEADLALVNQCLSGEIESYKLYKEYFHKDGHIIKTNIYVTILTSVSIFSVNIVPLEE